MVGLKEQCFGVEVEMTGITREQAAQALAGYFGTSAQYVGGGYDAWAVRDTSGKKWKIVSDSSIFTECKRDGQYVPVSDSEYRVEMVTPKLTYDELPTLQECVRRVRRAVAKVNGSCGIHVHVDAANHNRQSLKNLIGIMFSKEDILFKALQVNPERAEQYCKKVREPMLQKARALSSDETKDLSMLGDIWYEGFPDRSSHYNDTRYYALNLHSVFFRGTVEFRCFNSTLHAGKVAAYVNLWSANCGKWRRSAGGTAANTTSSTRRKHDKRKIRDHRYRPREISLSPPHPGPAGHWEGCKGRGSGRLCGA